MTRLVLASASPARLVTLRQAGIDPLVVVSQVDEPAVLAEAVAAAGPLEPADQVLVLARAKALDVASRLDDASVLDPAEVAATDEFGAAAGSDDVLVLGCDSMLELDGEVLGKPADAGEAVARWRAMRGRVGVLHTGHWLVDLRDDGSHGTLGATASTTVHFADLSDAEIDAYVATGEPLRVAGAFTIDGLGGPFVDRLEGDHHNVVGVSLPLLRHLLARVDLTVVDLWSPTT